MIYSLLVGRDCETTTSSSSSQPYSCPGHNHEDNGEQEQVHLLKSITAETDLGCCRNVKSEHEAQGTTIKLSSSDHMISLNPFKPIHDDPSCRNSGRVCVDCNTTKTPLWRGGPQGPKSLCNACGIRYRKSRRALAAIAAGDDHPSKFQASHRPNLKRSKLQQHVDPRLASKKRSKLAVSGYSHCSSKKKGSHQLCFHMENLQVGSDHDAKEAAVLLMALSCGLVHG